MNIKTLAIFLALLAIVLALSLCIPGCSTIGYRVKQARYEDVDRTLRYRLKSLKDDYREGRTWMTQAKYDKQVAKLERKIASNRRNWDAWETSHRMAKPPKVVDAPKSFARRHETSAVQIDSTDSTGELNVTIGNILWHYNELKAQRKHYRKAWRTIDFSIERVVDKKDSVWVVPTLPDVYTRANHVRAVYIQFGWREWHILATHYGQAPFSGWRLKGEFEVAEHEGYLVLHAKGHWRATHQRGADALWYKKLRNTSGVNIGPLKVIR